MVLQLSRGLHPHRAGRHRAPALESGSERRAAAGPRTLPRSGPTAEPAPSAEPTRRRPGPPAGSHTAGAACAEAMARPPRAGPHPGCRRDRDPFTAGPAATIRARAARHPPAGHSSSTPPSPRPPPAASASGRRRRCTAQLRGALPPRARATASEVSKGCRPQPLYPRAGGAERVRRWRPDAAGRRPPDRADPGHELGGGAGSASPAFSDGAAWRPPVRDRHGVGQPPPVRGGAERDVGLVRPERGLARRAIRREGRASSPA